MKLDLPVEKLPRTTKPLVKALKKLEINTVQDLLFYFPYRYLDFALTKKIKDLKPGENVSIKAVVKTISSRFSFRGRLSLAEAIVSDESGSVKVVWFNQPYLAKTLQKGDEVFLSGMPEYYNYALQMTNPLYEKASDFPVHTARLVPLYHLTKEIYPKTFRNLIKTVLPIAGQVPENLPESILKRQHLLPIKDTVQYSHFPENHQQMDEAKKRLAFEEIFFNQLLAQRHKLQLKEKQSLRVAFNQPLVKRFVSSLPFELTPAQKKSAWDILQDLEKPMPMNRLLEGDVGSGKTLVALIAALETAAAGLQAILLAPTEILAKQHMATALKFLSQTVLPQPIPCFLLTNQFSAQNGEPAPKKTVLKHIGGGTPGIYIGTHALLAEKISFSKLAFVVIDEQHRFGVRQRARLIQTNEKVPHLLSLTATPIPRTLQLAYYGELDISQIKSKPAGRKPIISRLAQQEQRKQAYEFIDGQIQAGRQAFVVVPLVEENDKLGVKSVKSEFATLQKVFPQYRVGMLHGKMKGKEKEDIMGEFLANRTHILVSTSVIEVGVDVPNASVMVIEAADRFGLAQLHQFRGRVGRSDHQSYCLLFTDNQNQDTLERLSAFTKISDGFQLAELDLRQRGFGELYGSEQSGWNFKYFSPAYTSLIQPAREEALRLLQDDIELNNFPLLQEKIRDKVVHFE